jgi:hypothetical protein
MKRQSIKKAIEACSRSNPIVEHRFVKIAGQPIASTTRDSFANTCTLDMKKFNDYMNTHSSKQKPDYIEIHTHPSRADRGIFGVTPSFRDLDSFIAYSDKKTMVIAQQNKEDGEIQGYLVVRKTKRTPQYCDDSFIYEGRSEEDSLVNHWLGFIEIRNKYHLNSRLVPANGFKLDSSKPLWKFVKVDSLERRAA